MNAISIWLRSTATTKPTSTTNTSIRQRKMRGEDSFSGSNAMSGRLMDEFRGSEIWHNWLINKNEHRQERIAK
jgi:hypothetical protein